MAKRKESKKQAEDIAEDKVVSNAHSDNKDTEEASASEANEVQETDELSEMKNQLTEMTDKYLRLTAEYQNYRKRVEKEKSDIFKFGTEKLFLDLLPVMDNFERAFNATNVEKADQKIMDGMLMIKKSLEEFFDKNGVKKIEALGKPFDPTLHHAVLSEEVDETDSEHVVEVFQDGYMMNEKVIRASMVKVSK